MKTGEEAVGVEMGDLGDYIDVSGLIALLRERMWKFSYRDWKSI
jgi:hypothetical protein